MCPHILVKIFLKLLLSTHALADPGEGPGLLFTKLAEKNVFGDRPSPPPRLSKDLDDRAPSVSQGLELVTGTGHPLKPDPLNHVNTGKVIHAKFPREQSFICCFILQPETPTNESY